MRPIPQISSPRQETTEEIESQVQKNSTSMMNRFENKFFMAFASPLTHFLDLCINFNFGIKNEGNYRIDISRVSSPPLCGIEGTDSELLKDIFSLRLLRVKIGVQLPLGLDKGDRLRTLLDGAKC